MSIYTEKTLKKLRNEGWQAQVVEKWLQACRRRVDLFGIIDIVAIRDGEILGVQSTSYNGRRSHLDDMMGEKRQAVMSWLQARGRLVLMTWKKEKVKRGGVAFRYSPVVDELTLERVEKAVEHLQEGTFPLSHFQSEQGLLGAQVALLQSDQELT